MAYVKTRLGRWFVEEHGAMAREGDAAIVLLHGLLFDGGMWKGQVGPLSELGRVVVLDGPGHGKSEVPPPFTLEEHARAVVDAMDELRVATAVVVGLSWGAMTGMRLALSRPDRLRALVVLDASAAQPVLRERLEYALLCAVARRVGLPDSLVRKRVVPLLFGERTRKRSSELVDDFVKAMGGYAREGLARAATTVSIDRPSILGSLSAIRTPTLVGYGEDDVATPRARSLEIASRIRGATLVSFPGVGHMSALEDPAVVNLHLVPFVRDHLAHVPKA